MDAPLTENHIAGNSILYSQVLGKVYTYIYLYKKLLYWIHENKAL